MLDRIRENDSLTETVRTESVAVVLDATTVDIPPLPALDPWRRFWRSLPLAQGFGNYMVMDPEGLRCYGASDWEVPSVMGTRESDFSSLPVKLGDWIVRHSRWRLAEKMGFSELLEKLQQEMEADCQGRDLFMSDPRFAITIALTLDIPLPFDEWRDQMASAQEVELILGAAGKQDLVSQLENYVAPDASKMPAEAGQMLAYAWKHVISRLLLMRLPELENQQPDPLAWDPETDAMPPFGRKRASILLDALNQAS